MEEKLEEEWKAATREKEGNDSNFDNKISRYFVSKAFGR